MRFMLAVLLALAAMAGPAAASDRLLVTGDSLAVGIAPYLPDALPGWRIHAAAAVGRRAAAGAGTLRRTQALPAAIAVSLGTNDDPAGAAAFRASVRALLRVAGPRRCVAWATIRRPPVGGRSYASLNGVLRSEARAHHNLRLVPWKRLADAHPEWRAPDGVHATARGYAARARAYARAIRRCVSRAGSR